MISAQDVGSRIGLVALLLLCHDSVIGLLHVLDPLDLDQGHH